MNNSSEMEYMEEEALVQQFMDENDKFNSIPDIEWSEQDEFERPHLKLMHLKVTIEDQSQLPQFIVPNKKYEISIRVHTLLASSELSYQVRVMHYLDEDDSEPLERLDQCHMTVVPYPLLNKVHVWVTKHYPHPIYFQIFLLHKIAENIMLQNKLRTQCVNAHAPEQKDLGKLVEFIENDDSNVLKKKGIKKQKVKKVKAKATKKDVSIHQNKQHSLSNENKEAESSKKIDNSVSLEGEAAHAVSIIQQQIPETQEIVNEWKIVDREVYKKPTVDPKGQISSSVKIFNHNKSSNTISSAEIEMENRIVKRINKRYKSLIMALEDRIEILSAENLDYSHRIAILEEKLMSVSNKLDKLTIK